MITKGLTHSIIDQTENNVLLEVIFHKDFPYFEGHFEGFHLLPALLQINFVVEMGKKYLPVKNNPQTIPNMKFTKPIYPEMKVNVELKWIDEKQQVNFRFFKDDQVYSQGAYRP